MAKPISQYPSMPTPYTIKFIIIVWLAFLARHNPVSTIANPACMNITRNPVTSVQTKLMATLFCPTWFTTSPMVIPFFASLTVTSLAVPVSDPSGSPLARASAVGTGAPATSASVIGTGFAAGAGVAGAVTGAAGGAAAGVCAVHHGARPGVNGSAASNTLAVVFLLASSLLPNGVFHKSAVQNPQDTEQAKAQSNKHDHQPPSNRRGDSQTQYTHHKTQQRNK